MDCFRTTLKSAVVWTLRRAYRATMALEARVDRRLATAGDGSSPRNVGIDSFGKKTLQEISEFLSGAGLKFGSDLEKEAGEGLWWAVDDDGGTATPDDDASSEDR
jgi:hypothetical protein